MLQIFSVISIHTHTSGSASIGQPIDMSRKI